MSQAKNLIPPLNKIILVEDDTDIQTLIKISLETVGGFAVQPFSSGSVLLSQIESLSADLIILDVMMPEMDGKKVFEELHGNPTTASLPVIFMTAKASERESDEYTNMGAIGVIAKPFDPMSLPITVKRIWKEYHGR